MKRTLILKLEIDLDIWEDYEDVNPELLFEDWIDNVQIDLKGSNLFFVEEEK